MSSYYVTTMPVPITTEHANTILLENYAVIGNRSMIAKPAFQKVGIFLNPTLL